MQFTMQFALQFVMMNSFMCDMIEEKNQGDAAGCGSMQIFFGAGTA